MKNIFFKYLFFLKILPSIVFILLLLGSVIYNQSFFVYILFVLLLLFVFRPIHIIPVYIISSLSSNYFIFSNGFGISRFIGFILIFSGILTIIKNDLRLPKFNSVFLFVLLCFFFISSLFSITHSFQSFILFLQYFIIVVIFSSFRNIDLNLLTVSLLVSSLITLVMLIITLQENLINIQVERLTSGDGVNENRFAMMLAQLAAMLFSGLIIFRRNYFFNIILFLFILLSIFMIFLTGSRSALFAILSAILVISLYYFRLKLLNFALPIIFVIYIFYSYWNQIILFDIPLLDRFTLDGIKDSGGSQERFVTWLTLIPYALNTNPIFGFGFGAENIVALAIMFGLDKPAHNFIIDMFLQIGVIGMLLFLSYFVYVFIELGKLKFLSLILLPLLIIVTALFNGVGETIFPEKLLWNGIGLSWLYINNFKVISKPSFSQK